MTGRDDNENGLLKPVDWDLSEWAVVVPCHPRHRKPVPPGIALERSMIRGTMRSFDRGGRGTAALALIYLGRFYCN